MNYYARPTWEDVQPCDREGGKAGARFGRGHWNATGTPISTGELRLSKLREAASSGRLATLKIDTVDIALRAFRAFSLVAQGAPQPRVAASDDGAIGLEWESGDRELFFEVLPDGTNEWLQIENGHESQPVRNGDPERFANWFASTTAR